MPFLLLLALFVSAPPDAEDFGLPTQLTTPTHRAREANRFALHSLRQNNFPAALIALQKAIAESPTFLMARYNLACLHARDGRPEQAAKLVDQLLREDLYTFAPRYIGDPDLASLRASPFAKAIGQRIAALTPLWERVIAEGVRGLIVDRRKLGGFEAYENNIGLISSLRIGVLDLPTKRFFATAPPVSDAVGGIVDRRAKRTYVVGAEFSFCQHDFCPHLVRQSAQVFALPPARDPLGTLVKGPGEDTFMFDFRARPEAGGIWLDRSRLTGEDNDIIWSWLGDQALLPGPLVEPAEKPHGVEMEVDARGTQTWQPLPDGFALTDGILMTPRHKIDLGFRHRRDTRSVVLLAPDGNTALVVSNRDACVCSSEFEGTVFWSGISRVDLVQGTAVLIQHQNTSATAELDASGALYVQVGHVVTRSASVAAYGRVPGESMPAGFLLESLPLGGVYMCCSK